MLADCIQTKPAIEKANLSVSFTKYISGNWHVVREVCISEDRPSTSWLVDIEHGHLIGRAQAFYAEDREFESTPSKTNNFLNEY